MGYKSPNTYSLAFGCTSSNPLDSTAYFFGFIQNLGLTTVFAATKIPIPRRGRITDVTFNIYNSAVEPTGENTAFTIRKNDATDYAVYNSAFSGGLHFVSNLSIPVNIGDYIVIRIDTPAWVTNPQGTYINGNILIETG